MKKSESRINDACTIGQNVCKIDINFGKFWEQVWDSNPELLRVDSRQTIKFLLRQFKFCPNFKLLRGNSKIEFVINRKDGVMIFVSCKR